MLQAEEICKSYRDRNRGQDITVLDHCSLSIEQGESLGLMGQSGCGKSTLARVLLRLISCTGGKIWFQGEDITHKPNRKLKDFRRKVQFISQRPEHFFDPIRALGQSVKEAYAIQGAPEAEQEIGEVLELVKLDRALLGRYPHQVSGGEIQRLSIARALLLRPRLLILDEPTSMLDISVQAQVLHVLKEAREKKGLTYLFISHDPAVIAWMCGRCLQMAEGKIR